MLTSKFIIRALKIHQSKYGYSIQSTTVVAKDRVDCICPIHGLFNSRVHDHLYHQAGCKQCADEQKSNVAKFIKSANDKHKYRYTYNKTKYKNNYTPIIITCSEHGDFQQVPSVHLSAVIGCPICETVSKTLSQESFIEKATGVHGTEYDYSNTIYINVKQKVKIVCDIHGMFEQTPNNHIYKNSGCPKCAAIKKTGMYNAHNISTVNISNDTMGIIYLAMFTSPSEQFIKIGITTRGSIRYRYGCNHKGYQVSKVVERTLPILEANKIEQQAIKKFGTTSYIPHTKFGGYTECFTTASQQQLIQYITK